MAEKKDQETKAAEPEPTVTMTFEGTPYTGKIHIGVETFDVVDGKIDVPVRLIPAAHQAGFRQ